MQSPSFQNNLPSALLNSEKLTIKDCANILLNPFVGKDKGGLVAAAIETVLASVAVSYHQPAVAVCIAALAATDICRRLERNAKSNHEKKIFNSMKNASITVLSGGLVVVSEIELQHPSITAGVPYGYITGRALEVIGAAGVLLGVNDVISFAAKKLMAHNHG